MKDAVIPYRLPETNNHSFFFISQHVAPHIEAKMHSHDAWELYFVTCGQGMRVTGDTMLPFTNGDIVLIPPQMPHFWEYNPDITNADGEITYLMAAFSHRFIDSCIATFPEIRNKLSQSTFPSEAIKYGAKSSVIIKQSLMKMQQSDDLGQLCEMLQLIPLIFTSSDYVKTGKPIKIERDIHRIQQVATYVMAHYNRTITLDEIASHIGMNRSAFCTFFKRNKGITFSQFITDFRLKMACSLLENSQKRVSEICYTTGFNDLPHFIRVFTATYSMSPTKFRKQAKDNTIKNISQEKNLYTRE